MQHLKFKRFPAPARAPIRSSRGAAVYDLFSNETKLIKEYGCEAIKTYTGMKIPEGAYGRIAPQ